MTRGKAKVTGQLDPFRERQKRDVCGRFMAEQRRHQRSADLAWMGVLVSQFTPWEIQLLDDAGFLCPRDRDFVASVRAKQEHVDGGGDGQAV